MKSPTRIFLWISIATLILCCVWAAFAILVQPAIAGKVFSTCSAIAGIAAALQLDVSGFFERVLDLYADEEKYPFGPPSYITRELSSHGESPLWNFICHYVLYEPKTGFWLALLSLLLSIPAIWI